MDSDRGTRILLQQVQVLFSTGIERGLNDGQLLERILRGPRECADHALRILLQRHGPMVLGTCRSVLKHHQDSDDAFQATFLVLLRNARSIRMKT